MKRSIYGLVALGLLVSAAGQVKADYIFTTIDVPGSRPGPGGGTTAQGINDAGQIVGVYSDGTHQHGYLLSSSSYTTLDVPGSNCAEYRNHRSRFMSPMVEYLKANAVDHVLKCGQEGRFARVVGPY